MPVPARRMTRRAGACSSATGRTCRAGATSGRWMLKTCTQCHIEKPLEEFHKQPSGVLGRHSWCRTCFNRWVREDRWKSAHPALRAKWSLWTRYRLRPEQYAAMLEQQAGKCAICQVTMTKPRVDHDHATRRVRGLLCHHCNLKVAVLENESWVTAARRYLMWTSSPPGSPARISLLRGGAPDSTEPEAACSGQLIRLVKEMRRATGGRFPTTLLLENVPELPQCRRWTSYG